MWPRTAGPRLSVTSESGTQRDAAARNDEAVAEYERARRDDRPSDYLRSFEQIDLALASAPRFPPALFNRALLLETLGLRDDAIRAWSAVLTTDSSQWAAEARRRRAALQTPTLPDMDEEQWRLYVQVLPQGSLAEARTVAADLSRRTGDPFDVDAVHAVDRSHDLRTTQLFRDAMIAKSEFHLNTAAPLFRKVARTAGPLRLWAEAEFVIAQSWPDHDFNAADARLASIEADARHRGYRHLAARIQMMRGYCFTELSRWIEALAQYDAAEAEYARSGDAGGLAAVHRKRGGIFRAVGNHELAWRESFQSLQSLGMVHDFQARHETLGEAARAALDLGVPQIALLYQNTAVSLLRSMPAAERDEKLKKNLSVALRHRAEIELHLEQRDRATTDLREAFALIDDTGQTDATIRRSMQARAEEVAGQALMRSNPALAVQAYSRALALMEPNEYRTFRAALFAERADAWRMSGRPADAEDDLRTALAELHAEEADMMKSRKPGAGEAIWGPYFSRFRETYDLLIRQLAETQRGGEAFFYAERERAYDLLNLVLALGTPELRAIHSGIAQIEAVLPPGTFLVEYSILDDRTYTWILSNHSVEILRQRARRSDVERWTAAVQRAAKERNNTMLDEALFAPFDGLIAAPLAEIAKRNQGPLRLIFVPDGAMHGLPIAALRNPITRHYLIQDATIAIAPSAELYVLSVYRDRALTASPQPHSLLAIGDPAFNQQSSLTGGMTRLPSAKREVERIRTFYPHAEVRTENAATVPELLRLAPASDVVHIAAHAIVNPEEPFHSLLLLAPSPNDSGAVNAQQLLTRLKLHNTRLVVLSACSSAGGLPVGPEGVAPLVRPLIALGVPAVIGSLWDVEDATAEELLVSFHRHFRQGSDAAAALQAAQLDLLRNNNPGLRSVLAWAPFQVIGQTSSPFGPARNK